MNELLGMAGSTDSGYALITGIGTYRDPRIPRLRFTRCDAEALARLLIDPSRAAFPEKNVQTLLDEQATLRNIKSAISGWLFNRAGADSTVIVFFAGHGGQESDKTGAEKDGIA